MTPLLPLALTLALAACAGARDTVRVVTADPALRAAVLQLLPDIEARSGLTARSALRVERRDRAQLERYLRARLDDELPPSLARGLTETYAFLGLLPDTTDLRALLLAIYREQVAGFYDPDSAALFVLTGEPPGGLESVLVHELVHALQDQHVDLDSLTSRARGNDRRVAAHAVLEGQATVVMFEWMLARAAGGPVDLAELPDLGEALRPALEALNGQFPVFGSAPAIVREGLLFPYVDGARYVQAVWRRNAGRAAPFGRHLPQSTEQVMDPARALGSARDEPTELALDLAEGLHAVHEDNLGQLEVGVLLREHVGAGAADLARGWDGDRYVLFARTSGERGLVWYSVWDDAAARDRFVAALGRALDRLPRDARLERVEISGRPAARLSVGEGSGIAARVAGRAVR